MPADARKTRYTAKMSSGMLSARPATSRSGVRPAKIPCSRASSSLARDFVRRTSSALPRSGLSVTKPMVWLPVHERTVNVIAAATTRPARQTRRLACRTRPTCP